MYRTIIFLQIIAIVGFGVFAAIRLPLWNYIDEGSHFNYIQVIAQQHRLPLLSDPSSSEFFELGHKRHYVIDLGNTVYEAFQPPLFYLLATPLFFLSSDFSTKVIILRLFTFSVYLLTLLITLKLAKKIFPSSLLVKVFILSIFLLPSLIIRYSVISNASLEIFCATVYIYFGYSLFRRFQFSYLIFLSLFLSLGILTKFTLIYLLPLHFLIFILLYLQKKVGVRSILLLFLFSFVLLSPWFAFNYQHYHSFTSNSQSLRLQRPFVNPQYKPIDLTGSLKSIIIPEEWQNNLLTHRSIPVLQLLTIGLFFVLPLLYSLRRSSHLFFALPLFLAIVSQFSVTLIYFWTANLSRYFFSAFPAWIIFSSFTPVKKLAPIFLLISLLLWYFLFRWGYFP